MNISVDISNTILETDRMIIRPWRMEDLEDFYEYASVDGVGQMAGWTPHKNIEESKEILDMFIREKKTFALQYKENNKVIGSVGLEDLSINLGNPYSDLKGREIGYVLSKDYWGKGLMPEAVQCIIKHCFENEKYDFLQISHSIMNLQSKRVIEKCGFSFLKNHIRTTKNGEIRKSLYYVMKNDYIQNDVN